MSYVVQPTGLEQREWIDLGDGHAYKFTAWAPDLSIPKNAEQYAHLAHLIRTQPIVGAIVRHKCKTETGEHEGCIDFRTELTSVVPGFMAHPMWEVRSWVPLHIEPSLQSYCPCGDHGFIRNGKWVRA